MTQFEDRAADWLSVQEAVGRILAAVEPLEPERVEAPEALGRALAQGVLARAALPPWDNSAMDGYAVRQQDLAGATPENPVVLRVVGETRAGDVAGKALAAGEAIRIMTGAPIPPGADSVIRVEDSDAETTPGTVRIFSESDRTRNIRPGAQDMREGEEVLRTGTSVGAGQMGLLAAAGTRNVLVHRRPRVAILSSGDELAGADEFHRVLRGKAIPETNGPTLSAAVRLIGGVPIPLGIARDNRESILEKVAQARAAKADALLTSGGASLGELDLFKRVLDDIGLQLDFWRVKMRPGTPFSFGFLPAADGEGPLPVFGLPGNPASSFVTFQIFCRPYILRLAGHEQIHRPVLWAEAGESLDSPGHLTHFFRVTLQGHPASPVAYLAGPQTSGLVRSQGSAQGLAVVPEGESRIPEGDPVRVILLNDLGLGGSEPGYLPE
jgi:molybdopterin molybdotransferase